MKIPQAFSLTKLLSIVCLFALMFSACQQDEEEKIVPEASEEDASLDKYYTFLEEVSGMDRTAMTYDADHDRFVINEDMLMGREAIDEWLAEEAKTSTSGRTEQRKHSVLLSDANATNFKYYIESSVPDDWRAAAIQAFGEWSKTGTKLNLVEVSSASAANIQLFVGTYDDANWVARATLPTTGGTGTVEINPKYNGISATQKVFTMVHEMGHNLGFWHTDQTTGTLIDGTTDSDAASVMNSYVRDWEGFSYYDLVAVRVLYAVSTGTYILREGESYSSMSGVAVETCAESGQNVGYIDTGDWMAYSSVTIPTTGTYRVAYRVASESTGGTLSLDLNAGTIVLGTRSIPVTGGWQTWTTVTHDVTISAGTYAVGIYAAAGGWNLNWFSITKL